jgi:hypothetical protein
MLQLQLRLSDSSNGSEAPGVTGRVLADHKEQKILNMQRVKGDLRNLNGWRRGELMLVLGQGRKQGVETRPKVRCSGCRAHRHSTHYLCPA